MPVTVVAKGLSKTFHKGEQEIAVLRDLDLELAPGSRTAIVGPCGCGKSTFLQILGTLDRPDSGSLLFDDLDPFSLSADGIAQLRNRSVGFVFQFHHLLPEFDALENVMMPALIAEDPQDAALERARGLLEDVGLAGRMHHRPGELSGGEQQRVAIARALMRNPDLVLADEPTGNLDSTTGESVRQVLLEATARQGASLVVVTHARDLAARFDRVLVLTDGRLEVDA